MSTMHDALQTFMAEAKGLLEEMELGLLSLEQLPDDKEAINAVFRAAHTIKGSAGLFGLDDIVGFTHHAETLLDRIRDGDIQLNSELVGLFLRCRDHLDNLLSLVDQGHSADDEMQATASALIEQLRAALGESEFGDTDIEPATMAMDVSNTDKWLIKVQFGLDTYRNGMDPTSFVQYLQTLGQLRLTSHFQLPEDPTNFDPESCYIGLELEFCGASSEQELYSVFEFVREDCQLSITAISPSDQLPDNNQFPNSDGSANSGLDLNSAGLAESAKSAGEDGGLPSGNENRQIKTNGSNLIRVHADKLDALINLVGELVTTSAGVSLLAGRHHDAALIEATSDTARLVEDIRESAMRLRMVEIGETFNRFRRVVRDVAKELGKEISLKISGGDTELDKSVVEQIGDPLTHLIRNAIDHGIETPEVRRASGKPECGTLKLHAYHESGGIIIEVADDGAGLNSEKIRAKAVQKGLISADASLSEMAIAQLIFEPGFSTSEKISNISGRGVGMDVVKRNIEALRGTITIDSEAGVGTTFRIRLPLTLAIIDGFLLGVGDANYVLPLELVQECVELPKQAPSETGRSYINLRGEVLPLLRVRDYFGIGGNSARRENVLVVRLGHRKIGLVVDELKGELQTVIKPLGPLFEQLKGVSGSTILGSGDVALMLDVGALLDDIAQFVDERI
jgi:two-component system chemotaxis sensor kinase CheA